MTKKDIRLPTHVIPVEYLVTLQPNFETFTFTGSVAIDLLIKKHTKDVVLHGKELEIKHAYVSQNKKTTPTSKILYNDKNETVTFSFPSGIKSGKTKLHIEFSGILNDKMRGFYRSKYELLGKTQHMAVTQFEATDARRAFVCFDEPDKKAVFQVCLIVPKDHQAISNTIEENIKDYDSRHKIVTFAKTPKMSTYLLAFIVGHFEHIEKTLRLAPQSGARSGQEGLRVRIFVTPGKKKQAEFALETAVRCLEFYERYFGIKYPLPVLDLIAIPDFAAGAMENWGAVTYRETALLVDPTQTATANKQWIALVIAHELAHQWFGNLVTMEWWTHLWLNEGFASYIEYLAVDEIFPKWDIWTQFVFMDHAKALSLDGLKNTHPIEVEVRDPNEISEIFDAVSYSKGASIIRMLAKHLGAADFRKGLHIYLKKYAYGNASTSDLWKALKEASGKPVEEIMSNWTQKAGYPLVTLSQTNKTLVAKQSRFYSSIISQKKSKDTTVWSIPFSLSSEREKPEYYLMDKKTMIIPYDKKTGWVKANINETSFIRVLYPKELLVLYEDPIRNKKLKAEDRFGIIRDIFSLSESGKVSTADVLQLYPFYGLEEEYIVWAEIISQLSTLHNLLAEEECYQALRSFYRYVLSGIAQKVGWEKKPHETHSQTLLRSIVLYSFGKYGDLATIHKAQKLFEDVCDLKTRLDPDILAVVYALSAENGNFSIYQKLLKLYKEASLQEEKDRVIKALCAFKDKKLLEKTLEFAFSKDVRSQDLFKAVAYVWANPKGRYMTWKFVQKQWPTIVERFSGGHLFPRFIQPAQHFTKLENAKEVEDFFKKNKAPGAQRTIAQALEQIESNAKWLDRDGKTMAQFLELQAKN